MANIPTGIGAKAMAVAGPAVHGLVGTPGHRKWSRGTGAPGLRRIWTGCAAAGLSVVTPLQQVVAQTRDLYGEVNVSGSVTVSIADAQGRPHCARRWWVKRLTGGVSQLGTVCGVRTLDIPSFLGISLASKLRGSADAGTVIVVTARESVAKTISFGS